MLLFLLSGTASQFSIIDPVCFSVLEELTEEWLLHLLSVTCTFFPLLLGDLKKTIEIVIGDDAEPEDNESLMIGLVNTAGGSRILPSSDTVTIVILANDNVAGIVGFHLASRSVIAREGGYSSCISCCFSMYAMPFVNLILLYYYSF